MKKVFLWVLLITIMISCLVFAGSLHFATAQTSAPTSTGASGESGALKLTMTTDKTTYSLGEPVNLTLTITNISTQTISFTHSGYDFDFQVTNDTNSQVYRWSNFKAFPDIVTISQLQSGENISANFTWLQTCNFDVSVQDDPVSPGTYNIIGLSSQTYGIQTTPIQITIVGASTSAPTSTTNPTPSPSSTPTPSPTVPEFSAWTALLIIIGISLTFIVFNKKRTSLENF
ncbi:MAG TPA: BsuPI-related putative proteinase inhibitor [Candidatus Acidoferrum sp.]|nr:BsuPI-related putative proteinase inhibitor [Candidatus Acidoferrum sp.]